MGVIPIMHATCCLPNDQVIPSLPDNIISAHVATLPGEIHYLLLVGMPQATLSNNSAEPQQRELYLASEAGRP